MLNALSSVPKN